MATLKKRRDTWYARVRVWNNDTHKQKEIQIPLKTSSKVTAMIRLSEVNKAESVIKDGTITNYKKYFMFFTNIISTYPYSCIPFTSAFFQCSHS